MNKEKHTDNYFYDLVRNNIKKYRKKKGITQEELADLSGFSWNYIAKIECGDRDVTIAGAGRIADALDIDIKDLFESE